MVFATQTKSQCVLLNFQKQPTRPHVRSPEVSVELADGPAAGFEGSAHRQVTQLNPMAEAAPAPLPKLLGQLNPKHTGAPQRGFFLYFGQGMVHNFYKI